MSYYVMVGGTRDGEPWDGLIEQQLQLVSRPTLKAGDLGIGHEQFAQLPARTVETYTLRIFNATDRHGVIKQLKLYGLASLSDIEVQLALLKNYKPRKGK